LAGTGNHLDNLLSFKPMPEFCHLHNHTQFSLLDGASDIGKLLDKAKADGQRGVAITDHGNMFGAYKFVAEAHKRDIKPIVGCEFYLVEDASRNRFERSKGEKDIRHHQLMIAKNETGYKNLSKLASLGFTEGKYGKYPRIDKKMIEKHHEGIIATSCCIGAEIPQAILHGKLEEAEKLVKWWVDLLGEDFYIELQRQGGLEDIDGTGMSQEDVNQELIRLAQKFRLKTIVTNDSHYIDQDDAESHDVLLSINTGSILEDEKRFRFPSNDFYFKTQSEMNTLFSDLPAAGDHTMEIYDKVEPLNLASKVVLPKFPLPKGFASQEDYLRHLTFEGAKRRWNELTPLITERLNFELGVIKESGYPGYFLIVQDFTTFARKAGVSVGPGRGSAAGSAVAYCLGITNIDPIKYDLLFERFLNPERISMPDIDIDFDDEGRSKVIEYVKKKYGENQVAQIITYGTMAAKMSLRDVGRVMDIPLSEVDRVAKSFPSHLKASLQAILEADDINPSLREEMNSEDVEKAYKFRELAKGKDPIAKMIQTAKKLEGSVRNTGVHACGVIITPEDVTHYIPVSTAKDDDMIVSQYDNSVVESAGLLKMDFLGLKTLSIIKDAVEMIRKGKGVEIDIENIDLEDQLTYELFQRGETIGIFQYESPGMQKHLKELKPNKFEDLIAMNALYRPGPMKYIPDFVARKHGRQPISYDLPEMEEILAETYGITVYQEQVMLLSQKLAGFSKGQADKLRKGMGKKMKDMIDKLYPIFLEGCMKNGIEKGVVDKIWQDWEAFASYAFNKSHSTCYAYVAFQTAYLKAHYPAEFMASVLNHNKRDISKVNFFLRECRRLNIPVLGPDVNESARDFAVNRSGKIRFGLSALKGVGDNPVSELIEERTQNGPFGSIYDLCRRVNLRAVNKKSFESMALGGAFDLFGQTRAAYFVTNDRNESFIDILLRYGHACQKQKNDSQMSLFGDLEAEFIAEPAFPEEPEWMLIEKLEKEKEVAGIYISAHPLDEYSLELNNFTDCDLDHVDSYRDQRIKVAGIVTKAQTGINRKGIEWGRYTLEDYDGSLDISLSAENFRKFGNYFVPGQVLYLEGVNQRGYNTDMYFFKLHDVKLLDTVGKQLTKSISLFIDLDDLTEDLLDNLEKLSKKHKGKHLLRMVVYEKEGQQKMHFVSKAKKLNVDNELLSRLEQLPVRIKIN
jgi:DNA polymerase-3 subunit alpha